MNQKHPLQAWGLLLILSVIWGSSFILIKKGLVGLTPLEVGSIRILSASLFLFPFALRNLKKVRRHQLKYLVSVGLVGSFFPAFLFAIAQTQLESALTGVLNALTPLFTIIIGILLYKVRYPKQVFAGILIGFLGTFVLITAGSGGKISQFNFYVLLVVLATTFYAFNLNIIKHRLQGLKSMTITSISLLIVGPLAAVQLFGFTDFVDKIMYREDTMLATTYILLLGVVGTALALIIFNKLVSITEPVFTSSVTYIIPIVSVIWGVLDGEVLQIIHLLGIATILFGVFIANRQQSRSLAKEKT